MDTIEAPRKQHGGITKAPRKHHGGITEAPRKHHGSSMGAPEGSMLTTKKIHISEEYKI